MGEGEWVGRSVGEWVGLIVRWVVQVLILDCFIRLLFSLLISFTDFPRPSVPIPPRSPVLLFSSKRKPILSAVSDLFPILGHIREFLPLLSRFCRGAATLLQDVYQNVTTIKL